MIIKAFAKALLISTLFLGLPGCMGQDKFVSPETLQRLEGTWIEKNGTASIRFYRDETVKLLMPSTRPPTRLLSQLELMKDDTLAFGTGDRWNGPVRIKPADDWRTLHLHFPDKQDKTREIIVDFVRPEK